MTDQTETKTSPIAKIAKALAAAQAEMTKAVKDSVNPHFSSKYADLGSVMDACMPALNKNGIAVIQPIRDGENGRSVVTKFIHESGEILENAVPIIVGKNDMQGLGSAITYARRYGLMMLSGIAPEDDDGNAAVASQRSQKQEQNTPTAEEIKIALEMLSGADDITDLKRRWSNLTIELKSISDVMAEKDRMKSELEITKCENLEEKNLDIDDEIPEQFGG